jgi:hypothetical protein
MALYAGFLQARPPGVTEERTRPVSETLTREGRLERVVAGRGA